MNLALTFRKIAAFFWRDFAIARGYRGALLLETLEALFGVATFYYLSRFVQSPELSSELPAGTNYFAFALVGFAFFDYLSVALSAFDASIEEARQNRTLEALLVTQTSLPVILAGSALYPFVALALRTCVSRLGSPAVRLRATLGQLAWSGGNSARFDTRVYWIGNFIGELLNSLQAREPREVGRAGRFRPRWRNDVSRDGVACAPADAGAADSGDLFARRHARRASRRSGLGPALAFDCGTPHFRRDFDPAIVRRFCLGSAPHKNHRHSDPHLIEQAVS